MKPEELEKMIEASKKPIEIGSIVLYGYKRAVVVFVGDGVVHLEVDGDGAYRIAADISHVIRIE